MSLPLPTDLATALATNDIPTVLDVTLTHFGCQAGTVHLLRDGVLKLVASKNIPEVVVKIVETVPIGKGIAGLAAQRLEAVTICNLQTDTSGQAKPGAKATGMEGTVAVPMMVGGELRGVIGIGKAQAYDWPKEETDLLGRVANDLAARL